MRTAAQTVPAPRPVHCVLPAEGKDCQNSDLLVWGWGWWQGTRTLVLTRPRSLDRDKPRQGQSWGCQMVADRPRRAAACMRPDVGDHIAGDSPH